MALTELEIKVLKDLADGSNWNNNPPLDFNNPDYDSQIDESCYMVYLDTSYRAKKLGIKVNAYKGVLGSLGKKGCLSFWDGDCGEDMAVIKKCNFKKIREHLGLE